MRIVGVWLALLPVVAAGAPLVVRLATAAPDGTAWAREFRAFARNVETHTHGNVQVKWYWGGIAGDELAVLDRIGRGQVDGIASGGGLCQKLSPTMRALRAQGLIASHDEAVWLVGRLHAAIEAEFRKHDLVYIGGPVIGRELVFTRRVIHGFDELKRARLWRWDMDQAGIERSRAAGLTIVSSPLGDAGRDFDDGKLDGFITVPTVMLGFQWIPRVRHVLDWPHGYLVGCALVARRVWHQVAVADQEAARSDAAQAIARVGDLSRHMDEALLGGVLQKQGVVVDRTPEALRREAQAAMLGVNGDETAKIAALLEARRKSAPSAK